jgi:hypothetical protein
MVETILNAWKALESVDPLIGSRLMSVRFVVTAERHSIVRTCRSLTTRETSESS